MGLIDASAEMDAYWAGYEAFWAEKQIDAVPYAASDKVLRESWLQGWRTADAYDDLDHDPEGLSLRVYPDDPEPLEEAAQAAPRVLFDHVDEDTRNVWFAFPSGERLTAVETSLALGEIEWVSSYVEALGWDEQQTLAKRFEMLESACIAAWRLTVADIGG